MNMRTKSGRYMEGDANQDKIRDHVGLIEGCFLQLLGQMMDLIGRIQRDAGVEKAEHVLYTYDEIPADAKRLVEMVLVIDALIDETINTTCMTQDQEEILRVLKQESDEYERSLEELKERDRRALIWQEKVNSVLETLATESLGPDREEEELLE